MELKQIKMIAVYVFMNYSFYLLLFKTLLIPERDHEINLGECNCSSLSLPPFVPHSTIALIDVKLLPTTPKSYTPDWLDVLGGVA